MRPVERPHRTWMAGRGVRGGVAHAAGRYRDFHGHIGDEEPFPGRGAPVHVATGALAEDRQHRGALRHEALRTHVDGRGAHGSRPDRHEVRQEDRHVGDRALGRARGGRRALRQHYRGGHEHERRRGAAAGAGQALPRPAPRRARAPGRGLRARAHGEAEIRQA